MTAVTAESRDGSKSRFHNILEQFGFTGLDQGLHQGLEDNGEEQGGHLRVEDNVVEVGRGEGSDGGAPHKRRAVVRVGADNLPYLFYSDPRVVKVVRKVGVRRKVAPPLDVRVKRRRRPRLVIMTSEGQAMPPNLIHLNERIKPRYSFKSR